MVVGMGYWVKDGSYVREVSDDTPRMIQGAGCEAEQRVVQWMKDWEEQERRKKEAESQAKTEYHEISKSIENAKSVLGQYLTKIDSEWLHNALF